MRTIKLLGRRWLIANLVDNKGNDLHDYWSAMKLAKAQDVEVPSQNLLIRLEGLPKAWDEDLKGFWFAENASDLKNPERSLFLPAAGFLPGKGKNVKYEGMNGYYWSSTVSEMARYSLYFDSEEMGSDYSCFHPCCLSVRCVLPDKKYKDSPIQERTIYDDIREDQSQIVFNVETCFYLADVMESLIIDAEEQLKKIDSQKSIALQHPIKQIKSSLRDMVRFVDQMANYERVQDFGRISDELRDITTKFIEKNQRHTLADLEKRSGYLND